MQRNAESSSKRALSPVELRTGTPYANLIKKQGEYAEAVAEYFGIDPRLVLPTTGTTGAIESVRNHIHRSIAGNHQSVLTVLPGYWRARECFEGLGLKVIGVRTEPFGFSIDERVLAEKAKQESPALIYLSLPNNPTGAVFDPQLIINEIPESIPIMLDLTLPSREMRLTINCLCDRFEGRQNLFLVGSTSKSHNTAEHRVGWAISTSLDNASELKKENRNVVSSHAIEAGMEMLKKRSEAFSRIDRSFDLLSEGESSKRYLIVRPDRCVQTGYVLIKSLIELSEVRGLLAENAIQVMWGSEFGLTDQYFRVETLQSSNIEIFVETINCRSARAMQVN